MSVATLPAAPPLSGRGGSEDRVRAAALRCIARWGVAKTTLDDVAREASVSRATVYRLFSGGKDGLMEAVAATEVSRFFAGVGAAMAEAETLEDTLVLGMSEAGRRILHHPALRFLMAHEPEAVLPRLAFAKLDEVLDAAARLAAPHLQRHLAADDAARAAEWAARLVLSYACTPGESHVDIADEASVRRLVRSFVLPGLVPTKTK
jgi:AcrR family transcriptional regulator